MEDTWSVEIWGVRGAAPAAYRDFLEYGGNTSCISVDCCGETVIFDAGTGLLELGREILTITEDEVARGIWKPGGNA